MIVVEGGAVYLYSQFFLYLWSLNARKKLFFFAEQRRAEKPDYVFNKFKLVSFFLGVVKGPFRFKLQLRGRHNKSRAVVRV